MYYTKELCQNKEKTENTDILHSFLRIRIAKKKATVLLFEKSGKRMERTRVAGLWII